MSYHGSLLAIGAALFTLACFHLGRDMYLQARNGNASKDDAPPDNPGPQLLFVTAFVFIVALPSSKDATFFAADMSAALLNGAAAVATVAVFMIGVVGLASQQARAEATKSQIPAALPRQDAGNI